MSHIIIVRAFKPGDVISCKELLRDGVMSSLSATFWGMLLKESIFQLMLLFCAMAFIFLGMPFTVCFLIVPMAIILVYVGTYISFTAKVAEIDREVNNIPRLYMSNAFSCFWVAEAFQPYLTTRHPKEVHYTVMTEQQFRESNIDVSSQTKKIVGTIGLFKSHTLEGSAWIKRLCVHKEYQRKGVATCLLSVAVQFAADAGYSCANLASSEYTEGGRELCLKKGFELKEMYHKSIIGSFITILMYELSFEIKSDEDNLPPQNKKELLNLKCQ
ncbi:N-acetyltransferase family 8 member 3-like [Linepithema humile]|uniref:N-acetyltransferase family 8 member 3-like n=1 Tax=Linepithema humile TaxID=83485 RepID=UPI00351F7B7F